jgi:hypothetical protein
VRDLEELGAQLFAACHVRSCGRSSYDGDRNGSLRWAHKSKDHFTVAGPWHAL